MASSQYVSKIKVEYGLWEENSCGMIVKYGIDVIEKMNCALRIRNLLFPRTLVTYNYVNRQPTKIVKNYYI
jgi:hypothetical protein